MKKVKGLSTKQTKHLIDTEDSKGITREKGVGQVEEGKGGISGGRDLTWRTHSKHTDDVQ